MDDENLIRPNPSCNAVQKAIHLLTRFHMVYLLIPWYLTESIRRRGKREGADDVLHSSCGAALGEARAEVGAGARGDGEGRRKGACAPPRVASGDACARSRPQIWDKTPTWRCFVNYKTPHGCKENWVQPRKPFRWDAFTVLVWVVGFEVSVFIPVDM